MFHEYDVQVAQLPRSSRVYDETLKNGSDAIHRFVWSAKGQRAVVRTPFARGNRVSILIACDSSGFISWRTTRGTFTCLKFHHAFVSSVLMHLNPWPLPRSFVVLCNARIHMYAGPEAAIHSPCGAILIPSRRTVLSTIQ
ncbi:Transposase [Phytophthora megakarya]|uniref:Transposase n=1 Tax=Phytophthora megakarya TaxID=4795 RepID=A0A225WHR3_9STRA|nr:Transposase [Phytophthora megakarya]